MEYVVQSLKTVKRIAAAVKKSCSVSSFGVSIVECSATNITGKCIPS